MNANRLSRFFPLVAAIVACLSAKGMADVVQIGDRSYVRVEQRANTFTTGAQEQAALAMDAEGNLIVCWDSRRQEEGNYGAYAQRFDAVGRTTGGEIGLNLTRRSAQRSPGVIIGAGQTLAFWESFGQDGSGFGVFGRSLDQGAAEWSVNELFSGDQSEMNAVMGHDGRAFVVWIGPVAGSTNPGHRALYGRLLTPEGLANGPEIVLSNPGSGTDSTPSLASCPDGTFLAVWARSDELGDTIHIMGRRFDASGKPAGDEFVVSLGSVAIEPAIAVARDGRVVVAWHEPVGEGYSVAARAFDGAGLPTGPAFTVGDVHAGYQNGAALALANDGEGVFVWNRLDDRGHYSGIFGQRFALNGVRHELGDVFRVTQAEAGKQFLAVASGRPRVVIGSEGQIAVAWNGDGGPGDKNGTYLSMLLPYDPARKADVDGDGTLTSNDLAAFCSILAGGKATPRSWTAADFNGDGNVNPIDIQPLANTILDAEGRTALTDAEQTGLLLAGFLQQRPQEAIWLGLQLALSNVSHSTFETSVAPEPHQPPLHDPNFVPIPRELADGPMKPRGGGDFGFLGIVNTGWWPPDPHSAVGPNHVVVMTNGAIAFLQKADGTLDFQDEIEDSFGFWGEVGATGFVFDPEVIYDPYTDRFMAMCCERATNNTSQFLLAISDDSDPNGDWFKFRINVTGLGGNDIDSPNIAVDENIIYLSADFFTPTQKYLVAMFEKAPMLEGNIGIKSKLLITGTQSHGMPVMYGPAPAMYLIEHFEAASNTKIRLTAITDQLGVPTTTQQELTVDAYGPPEDPPQKGSSVRPETFDSRFWSCMWRNGSLWATHHINSNRVVARWYEIKTNDWPTSGDLPEVVQQGNIDPGNPIRTYFSAISVDEFGNAGIVFARSSSDEYISMSRALRLADDPPGTFGPAKFVKGSADPHTTGRWGDYAGIEVDPNDDRTFWIHHEYNPGGTSNWNTWIASFGTTAPACDGDANGDGIVDPLDTGYVSARFGCPVGTGDTECDAADVNLDLVVDPLDVGYIQARFGTCE